MMEPFAKEANIFSTSLLILKEKYILNTRKVLNLLLNTSIQI